MLTISDQKKKNQTEVLLIVKRSRAKGLEDNVARVYEVGEEIKISGSPKLQLLAMGNATRDLETVLETKKKDAVKPNLHGMKNDELDILAETLGIDVSKKKRSEKIAAIKDAY